MKKRVLTSAVILLTFLGLVFFAPLWLLRLALCLCMALAILEILIAFVSNRKFDRKTEFLIGSEACLAALACTLVCQYLNREGIFYVVMTCALTDASGLIFGSLFKNKHMVAFLENISPNKSYEGYMGGFLVMLLLNIVVIICRRSLSTRQIVFMLCYAFIGPVLSDAGDLLGSATKRSLGIKDSNEAVVTVPLLRIPEIFMYGHGGYLDRFDSTIFSVVFYSLIISVWPWT